jgi:hypothetical protein
MDTHHLQDAIGLSYRRIREGQSTIASGVVDSFSFHASDSDPNPVAESLRDGCGRLFPRAPIKRWRDCYDGIGDTFVQSIHQK